MVDKNKEVTQLAERFDSQSVVALTDKQRLSIYKKSQKSGYSVDILEEVYFRGMLSWEESFNQTPEQYGFGRVNSFISGGKAAEMDRDLIENKECTEPISTNPDDPSSRFIGTDSLTTIYANETPGQSRTLRSIKDAVRDVRESEGFLTDKRYIEERAVSRTQQRLMGAALAYKRGESENASAEVRRLARTMSEKELEDFASTKHDSVPERVEEDLQEATYKGKKVKLNKPFRTPGEKKKFAVYVDPDGDGKAQIVRFGDPNMSIKKDQPGRKKSYCARSKGIGKLNDKTSANYWSRRMWDC